MDTSLSWNSLEIAKLAVAALTPLAVAAIGFVVVRATKRIEAGQWVNQKLIEKRIALFGDALPQLNDLYCYFACGGFKLGIPGIKGLELNFSATHTWVEQQSKTEQIKLSVPPGKFGWIEIRPLMRRVDGHWKITTANGVFTVPGDSIAPVAGRAVSEFVTTVTSTYPPTQDKCPHGTNPVDL